MRDLFIRLWDDGQSGLVALALLFMATVTACAALIETYFLLYDWWRKRK